MTSWNWESSTEARSSHGRGVSPMLTTFAAFIGATSGVISLWWLLRNWSLDRADVRLRVAVSSRFVPAWEQSPSSGARMLGGSTKRILTITLVNHGRRDAQVDS